MAPQVIEPPACELAGAEGTGKENHSSHGRPCCGRLRREFQAPQQLTIFATSENNARWPDVFGSSPWCPTWRRGFLLSRALLLLIFLAHLGVDMGDFWWEGYYLIQFTAWILLAQAIYFALAVFTTWKAQWTTIQRSEKVALPWFARLCVALMHLCVPGSLLVALGYWATFPSHESHAAIVYTTAFAHGISAVLALADLLLGGCAFALRYFFFLVVYMILFTCWSILHHVTKIGRLQGCRNYERHACPIYPMLDWHEPVTTAVSCLVAVVALPLLMSLLGLSASSVRAALAEANLTVGGIALRYPEQFRLGGLTNPDPALREEAVNLTVQSCKWAQELSADEVVVWPQTDGYDYAFQVDYPALWSRSLASFRAALDHPYCRPLKLSIEFKPTDEISRFAAVPSTGAALLFVAQVDRPNLGVTLDLGHLLMAGENPAQSVAMAGAAGKLFGIHLNDGHSRLGAEDGLMFGSVHETAALETVFWLQKIGYKGSIYFDTFPHNEDPVREAEHNIRKFKSFWERAEKLRAAGIDDHLQGHDALAALELLR